VPLAQSVQQAQQGLPERSAQPRGLLVPKAQQGPKETLVTQELPVLQDPPGSLGPQVLAGLKGLQDLLGPPETQEQLVHPALPEQSV